MEKHQQHQTPRTILSVTYPGIICRRLIGASKQTEAVCAQTLNSFFQSGRSPSAPSSLHHCRHEIPSLCPEQAWMAPLCFSLTDICRLEKPFPDIQTKLRNAIFLAPAPHSVALRQALGDTATLDSKHLQLLPAYKLRYSFLFVLTVHHLVPLHISSAADFAPVDSSSIGHSKCEPR